MGRFKITLWDGPLLPQHQAQIVPLALQEESQGLKWPVVGMGQDREGEEKVSSNTTGHVRQPWHKEATV